MKQDASNDTKDTRIVVSSADAIGVIRELGLNHKIAESERKLMADVLAGRRKAAILIGPITVQMDETEWSLRSPTIFFGSDDGEDRVEWALHGRSLAQGFKLSQLVAFSKLAAAEDSENPGYLDGRLSAPLGNVGRLVLTDKDDPHLRRAGTPAKEVCFVLIDLCLGSLC